MNKFTLIFIVALVFNCSSNQKTEDEQEIFNEIFGDLTEQVFLDYRKVLIPPPPPKNDSDEEIEKMEKAFKKAAKLHEIYLDSTEFAPLFVVVNDTINPITQSRLDSLIKNNNKFVNLNSTIIKPSFKIRLDGIKLDSNYILKYKSELKKSIGGVLREEYSKERHLKQYSGILYLSQIYFNQTGDLGFFEVGFACGKLCSSSYLVFIKKEGNKWGLQNIKSLGFS